MKLSNTWIRKTREASLIRIVEWSQRHNVRVEDLTDANIKEALKNHDGKELE